MAERPFRTLSRRNFLKIATISSLGVLIPTEVAKGGKAFAAEYKGNERQIMFENIKKVWERDDIQEKYFEAVKSLEVRGILCDPEDPSTLRRLGVVEFYGNIDHFLKRLSPSDTSKPAELDNLSYAELEFLNIVHRHFEPLIDLHPKPVIEEEHLIHLKYEKRREERVTRSVKEVEEEIKNDFAKRNKWKEITGDDGSKINDLSDNWNYTTSAFYFDKDYTLFRNTLYEGNIYYRDGYNGLMTEYQQNAIRSEIGALNKIFPYSQASTIGVDPFASQEFTVEYNTSTGIMHIRGYLPVYRSPALGTTIAHELLGHGGIIDSLANAPVNSESYIDDFVNGIMLPSRFLEGFDPRRVLEAFTNNNTAIAGLIETSGPQSPNVMIVKRATDYLRSVLNKEWRAKLKVYGYAGFRDRMNASDIQLDDIIRPFEEFEAPEEDPALVTKMCNAIVAEVDNMPALLRTLTKIQAEFNNESELIQDYIRYINDTIDHALMDISFGYCQQKCGVFDIDPTSDEFSIQLAEDIFNDDVGKALVRIQGSNFILFQPPDKRNAFINNPLRILQAYGEVQQTKEDFYTKTLLEGKLKYDNLNPYLHSLLAAKEALLYPRAYQDRFFKSQQSIHYREYQKILEYELIPQIEAAYQAHYIPERDTVEQSGESTKDIKDHWHQALTDLIRFYSFKYKEEYDSAILSSIMPFVYDLKGIFFTDGKLNLEKIDLPENLKSEFESLANDAENIKYLLNRSSKYQVADSSRALYSINNRFFNLLMPFAFAFNPSTSQIDITKLQKYRNLIDDKKIETFESDNNTRETEAYKDLQKLSPEEKEFLNKEVNDEKLEAYATAIEMATSTRDLVAAVNIIQEQVTTPLITSLEPLGPLHDNRLGNFLNEVNMILNICKQNPDNNYSDNVVDAMVHFLRNALCGLYPSSSIIGPQIYTYKDFTNTDQMGITNLIKEETRLHPS